MKYGIQDTSLVESGLKFHWQQLPLSPHVAHDRDVALKFKTEGTGHATSVLFHRLENLVVSFVYVGQAVGADMNVYHLLVLLLRVGLLVAQVCLCVTPPLGALR